MERRRFNNQQSQRLYQARLTLHAIQGGGAMSPTSSEIIAANKVISETTDEKVKVVAQAKVEDAYNVNQGLTGSNTWFRVNLPE
jgi:hypothetical protein